MQDASLVSPLGWAVWRRRGRSGLLGFVVGGMVCRRFKRLGLWLGRGEVAKALSGVLLLGLPLLLKSASSIEEEWCLGVQGGKWTRSRGTFGR